MVSGNPKENLLFPKILGHTQNFLFNISIKTIKREIDGSTFLINKIGDQIIIQIFNLRD